MRHTMNKTAGTVFAGALLALATTLTAGAAAQDAKHDHAAHAAGQEMKAPQTAEEHRGRRERLHQADAVALREVHPGGGEPRARSRRDGEVPHDARQRNGGQVSVGAGRR
jgi:hypothetical protein